MAEVRGAASNAEHATLDIVVERRMLCIVRRDNVRCYAKGGSRSMWVGPRDNVFLSPVVVLRTCGCVIRLTED